MFFERLINKSISNSYSEILWWLPSRCVCVKKDYTGQGNNTSFKNPFFWDMIDIQKTIYLMYKTWWVWKEVYTHDITTSCEPWSWPRSYRGVVIAEASHLIEGQISQLISFDIRGICYAREARAVAASWVCAMQAPRMRRRGSLFPHLCNREPLLISIIPSQWLGMSQPLWPNETHRTGQGGERLIHLLCPWENFKSRLWLKGKVKDIHWKISDSVRRTWLFGQHSVPSAWHVGSIINTYGVLGKSI